MKFFKNLSLVAFSTIVMISCNKKIEKNASAKFSVSGMTCAIGCAKTIETKLSKTNGISSAKVNFDEKNAIIDFDSTVISKKEIVATVEQIGDGSTYKVSNLQ